MLFHKNGTWNILDKGQTSGDKLKESLIINIEKTIQVLQMETNVKVTEYFNRIPQITNQMKSYDEDFSHQTIVNKVIHILSSKFDYIEVEIDESKYLAVMQVEEMYCSLETQEQRVFGRTKESVTKEVVQAQTSKK